MKKSMCLLFACAAIILLGAATTVTAQSSGGGQPRAALSQSSGGGGGSGGSSGAVKVRTSLISDAASTDRAIQEQALGEVESIVGHDPLTASDKTTLYQVLDHLALSGIAYVAVSGTTPINDFPLIRMGACRELGAVGGEPAVVTLMKVLGLETRPTVLSEAVYQLGRIGLDPEHEVSRGIAFVLMRQTVLNPDDNFAYASLLAFEKIAAKNNGIKEPLVYSAITAVKQGRYAQIVQDKAATVLQELGQYE